MSIDYLKSMQLDQFSMQGEVMSPFIDAVLRDYYAKDDLLNYFCDRIMKWNFQMDAHEVAPAIFNVFVWKLLSNTFQDEMGDTLYQQFIKSPTFAMQVLDQLRQKPVSTWFDDVNTSQTETMNDIIFRSLDDTFQYFVQQQGIVVEDWNWGHLHHIQLEHPFSDRQHYHSFLTIGNYPCGGGNCTINAAQFLFTAPFQSSILSSLRQLIHVGDIKNSCSVLITGQSGQPLDPHYRDQVDLWLNGQYHPMLMDVHRIMESAFDLLTLEPK